MAESFRYSGIAVSTTDKDMEAEEKLVLVGLRGSVFAMTREQLQEFLDSRDEWEE